MKINEVDPRNYDSDIDYYDAVNRAGRKAYRDPDSYEKPEPYDAEDDIAQQRQAAAAKFRQKRETQWDTKQEGTAPNGQKYNSRYIINAVDKFTADMEEHSFTDYHWGAKKLVDKEYGKDGDRVVLTLYIVDNHKYGMWKPWADQPAQESAEQGVAEGGFKNKTAVFSGYSNYMNSRAPNVFKHYGIKVLNKEYFEDEDIVEFTVIGDGDSLDKARAHLERSDQFGGMIRTQGVAEGYPKHQDLSGISTDKLKAYLDKQSKQQVSGEGNQVKRVRAELQRRQQGDIADEKANPYAIGMAQAMKSTGDKPPLKKSTINKAHEIARAIKKGE